LIGAGADAEAVAAALQDGAACGYPAAQVQLITNGGATTAGILAALDELAARAGAGDTAFLFFSGQGALGTDGSYYLASHDVQIEGNRIKAGSGVNEGELLQKLWAIPAERVLIVFSAGHAGSSSPSPSAAAPALTTSSPAEDTITALLGTGKGRIVVAACRAEQHSYSGSGPLTLFTQALIDGLRGVGVADNHGFIGAFSLYRHIYETVSDRAKALHNVVQEPELTVLRGAGSFAVARYKGTGTLSGEFAAEPLPTCMAAREVSIELSASHLAQGENAIGTRSASIRIDNVISNVRGAGLAGGNVGKVNLDSDTTR
jgi:hypothetical protein